MGVHAVFPHGAPIITLLARGPGSPPLAAAYALVGACGLALSPLAETFAWIPVWLGVSHLIVAHAYATNRATLFGKCSDGMLSPVAVLVLLPYLLLVWGFFWLKLLLLRRKEPCFHRVADGIVLGRKPRRHELPPECELVVDLTAEFSEDSDVIANHAYRCLPVLNRHVPSDADFCALLDELHGFPGGMYIHCGAGRGRSAMVVAALLVLRGEATDAADAERKLRAVRPGVSMHGTQRALVDRCCLPRGAVSIDGLRRPGASRSVRSGG